MRESCKWGDIATRSCPIPFHFCPDTMGGGEGGRRSNSYPFMSHSFPFLSKLSTSDILYESLHVFKQSKVHKYTRKILTIFKSCDGESGRRPNCQKERVAELHHITLYVAELYYITRGAQKVKDANFEVS